MIYKPNTAYYKEFVTASPTTGAAANADAPPTATANRNGADDAAFVLTVTNIDTGRYKITGTVPVGYAAGDVVNVSVAATVGGVAAKAVVDTFGVDTRLAGEAVTLAAAQPNYAPAKAGDAMTLTAAYDAAKTALATGDARLNNLDATISSRSTYAGGAVASVTAPVTLTAAYDAAKTALATTDPRLDYLNAPLSDLQVTVDLAPVTNLLNSEVYGLAALRDSFLAAIAGGLTAEQVWTYLYRSLTDKEGFAPTVEEIEDSSILAKEVSVQALGELANPLEQIVPDIDPPVTYAHLLSHLYIPNYEGPVIVLPVNPDPDTQYLHFYGRKGDNTVSVGRTVSAVPVEGQFVDQNLIDKEKRTAVLDETGYCHLTLIRGLRYIIRADWWKNDRMGTTLTITDDDNRTFAAYIEDMLGDVAQPTDEGSPVVAVQGD